MIVFLFPSADSTLWSNHKDFFISGFDLIRCSAEASFFDFSQLGFVKIKFSPFAQHQSLVFNFLTGSFNSTIRKTTGIHSELAHTKNIGACSPFKQKVHVHALQGSQCSQKPRWNEKRRSFEFLIHWNQNPDEIFSNFEFNHWTSSKSNNN